MKLKSILLVITFLFIWGCQTVPERQVGMMPVDNPFWGLSENLDSIFSGPELDHAIWGVKVQSLETGEVIYSKNSSKILMPASNMKLLTGVATLKTLGPDFHYETKLYTDGKVENNILKGNLIVIAGGDPTIGGRFTDGDILLQFKTWAEILKEQGIEKIEGDMIGVDDYLDDVARGYGWSWDDLHNWPAAEMGAFIFNDNCIDLHVTAGEKVGDPAMISSVPDTKCVFLENKTTTVDKDGKFNVSYNRVLDENHFFIEGTVPLGTKDRVRYPAIHDSNLFFMTVLSEVFQGEGIEFSGKVLDSDNQPLKTTEKDWTLLHTHLSPEMREMLKVMLKVSQNLYAETFLKTVGLKEKGEGTTVNGVEVVQEILEGWGIPPEDFIMKDGSGLARYSYISPDLVIRLLDEVYHSEMFGDYYYGLPIAGVDGTIKRRMKGTAAEGNVRAKTGTLSHVRSLSGYVRSADGEMFAFSMLCNNHRTPGQWLKKPRTRLADS